MAGCYRDDQLPPTRAEHEGQLQTDMEYAIKQYAEEVKGIEEMNGAPLQPWVLGSARQALALAMEGNLNDAFKQYQSMGTMLNNPPPLYFASMPPRRERT